jgi:23S rRNA (guanosine2251-2'-O)-methyltransferase
LVRIPLRGATPSLNACVATALLLYEVARRGWMKGLRGSQPAPRLVRPQLPAPAAAAAELVTELVTEPEASPLALEEAPNLEEAPELEDAPEVAETPDVDEAPVADPSLHETTLDLGLTPEGPAGFNGDIQL